MLYINYNQSISLNYNKMKKWIFGSIGLLLLGTTNVQAQTKKLSLQDALNYAVQHNQRIANSVLEEQIGKQKTAEIRAQALPQLNGSASLTDNIKKQALVLPGEITGNPGTTTLIEAGTTWNATAAADFSQQLFNQSVFTGLQAARAGEEYYALQTAQTKESVIYEVTSLYYQLLVQKERVAVLDTNIVKLTELTKTTQAQYDNGLARKIDLDRIQVNLVNYQTQKTQLENQIRIQEQMLKVRMGMQVSESIELPELALSDIENKIAGVIDFTQYNPDSRIETQILKKSEELLEYQKKAYISEYFPSLSLGGRYSYNGMSNKFDLFKGGETTANWFSMASVSLNLRIPIFDGFARRSRVNQANLALRQMVLQQNEVRNNLDAAHDVARLQIKNSIQTIQTQQKNVMLAQDVYESTYNNYQLGLASLTDLLNAETAKAEAQNSYNQALLQYKIAELDLIKSNGNLLTLLN
jgi:outer membrane protein